MKSKHQDYEREDSDSAGFATGLFIGAAIGALAALLYAPKSGEETRQQLKDLADEQKDNLKNQWDRTKEAAAEVVNTAKEKVDSIAQRASTSVDEYADKAVNTVIQVADETKSTVDKFRFDNGNVAQSGQN
ncbi:YtxH domain-containing protein [Dyadobacter subterraneus]|uniref:YtxH domain-containing protein n=1 Tax=Dyadobacter subterraneus TaxID=2773304 RepID=A0ABR9WDQ1_9BACT|nr:YtxH domain-containing protein [Dyadobacter subterraneus]MBE9463605.1 YtxH domain-containing protein [Dyadobacter subterraneus]